MKDSVIRTLNAIRHPIRMLNKMMGKTQQLPMVSSPVDPIAEKNALFLEYSRLARLQGFDRLYVALSFDCDTPEDIPAAEQVHTWLSKRGIKATYAVPGAQLLQGAETYRRLRDMGADFINHGARPHTEWNNNRYQSITFYNEMTSAEVVDDLEKGHEIVQQAIGYTPKGFRAPHFGYFQSDEQRSLIYKTLRNLGYQYDTATLPEFGFKHGPILEVDGLYEFPLSGSYETPHVILDSWNYVYSPYYPYVKNEYATLFIHTVEQLLNLGVVGVLNYYVDPAHVYRADAFYWAMAYLLERGVPSMHYGELMDIHKVAGQKG
jgi:peptidoglycan/xylan/chitin deacetylase (PgdA/CDA1 family)